MSATINVQRKSFGTEFIKRTAGLISDASKDYISEVMPVSSSTLKEAKSTFTQARSTLTTSSGDILSRIRKLKTQNPVREIYRWYMDNDDEDNSFDDSNMEFDTSTDPSELADIQIGEAEKNTNKLVKTIKDTSRQLFESQNISTVNIQSSIDAQTAVISKGFDNVNNTLGKILEVMTKNTSALIEATVASNKQNDDPTTNMMLKGRFDLSEYKKILSNNAKNNPILAAISMGMTMVDSVNSLGDLIDPKDIFKSLINFGINKAAPKFKDNVKALDDVINNTIMESLIRLGSNKSNPFSFKGMLGDMFGIDSSRKEQSTARSSLELKSVPFDSLTKEAITNTIPGYLRKILIALGGSDEVYDYRSRSFKSHAAIKQEFMNSAARTNNIYTSSSKVRKAIGDSEAASMYYDLLLNQLGAESNMEKTLESFTNRDETSKYMKNLLKGVRLNKNEKKELERTIDALTFLAGNNNGIIDISTQARKNNVARNARVSDYISNADDYNVDISDIKDSSENDKDAILRIFGKKQDISSITAVDPKSMSGSIYTNAALYQIFRRLDTGINVFQVGNSNSQDSPYDIWGDNVLSPPARYKPKKVKNPSRNLSVSNEATINSNSSEENPNLLQNQEMEDGTTEELTKGQRFGRWAKHRGGTLRRAIFSGSPDQVRAAFSSIISDVTDVAGDEFKKGVSKIDKSFGNVSGYLKHKMFGSEYTYQDGVDEDGNPITKTIAKNEKGGIFGFVSDQLKESFSSGKDYVSKWMNTVKGYFDYGDKSSDADENKTAGKRKKLITSAVAAFAGAGILGHPIGLLVGALAGNALSAFGVGDKLKNMFFGHDKETGKPTGIFSKAADSIISPIKFQLGKTAHFLGSTLQKHILGPLSDIGMAIKDRMTDHVDSVFDKIKKGIGGFFGKIFGGLGKGLLKIGTGLATGITNAFGITLPGKAARGAIGATGGLIGGLQNATANKIAKNSYHRLASNEVYTIHKGEKYKNTDGTILTAKHDLTITGADGIKPHSKDYIKNRRKSRNSKIDNELSNSPFYSSGGLKGFFGGDYKSWREQEWQRRLGLKGKLSEYTSERVKTPEEIEAEKAAKEAAEAAKQTSENTQVIADATTNASQILQEEQIPGSSFKTHDQGLHDRLDRLIAIVSKEGNSSDSNTAEYVSSTVAGAASLVSSKDEVSSEESKLYTSIIDEAGKSEPNKSTVSNKMKDLMAIQDNPPEETTEKKESFLDKIGNFLGNGLSDILKWIPAIAGIGALLFGLFKNGGITELLDRVGTGLGKFSELFNLSNNQDATTTGMNAVTSLADVQANSSWDWATPFANLYHNKTDAAGNQIENTAVTEAKEEVLWKMPLREDIFGWKNKKYAKISDTKMAKASKLEAKAHAQEAKGGWFNKMKSKSTMKKANKALDQAVEADELANAPRTSTVKSIAKNAGRMAVMNVASQGVGNLAGTAATILGADEETANTIDNVATGATSAAMTINMASSAIKPNKKSWVDKIVNGISDMLKFIGEKVGADKAFKKIGATKVVSKLTKFTSKIASAVSSKLDDILIKKLTEKLAAFGVKNAATVATGGIAIAAGALVGLASGACGTEHLFGILPNEADAGMITISSVLGGVFGALEMTPIGWIIVIFDIVDAILVSIPGIECGIKQFVARELYKLLGNDEADASLAAKQADFENERKYYSEKFGVDMNKATFNDMVNNTGLLDTMWTGKANKGADGHLKYDDAGELLKSGGMKSWFVGSEKQYVMGPDGKPLKDENGKAIQAIDKYGHKLKKDMNWGDHVGNFFQDVGGALVGRNIYKTDENGNVMYDENNKPIIEKKENNIFFKAGEKLAQANNSVKDWIKDKASSAKDYVTEKTAELKENLSTAAKNVGDKLSELGDSALDFLGIKKKKNKNKDKDDKSSKSKSSFSLSSFMNKQIEGVKSLFKKNDESDVELDENGNEIRDVNDKPIKKGKLGDALSKAKGKLMSFFTNPIEELTKGLDEWEKSDSPWKRKASSAGKWIKEKATGLFDTIGGWFNKNNVGVGGGGDDSSTAINPASEITSSTKEGGNPLNKPLYITSPFGMRDLDNDGRLDDNHRGIDLIPADGSKEADIGARYSGKIVNMRTDVPNSHTGLNVPDKKEGNFVTIDADNGLRIKNFHLKAGSIPANLRIGSRVNVGDKIGEMGTTGMSTGKHLHYQIEQAGTPIDPHSYVTEGETMSSFTRQTSVNHMPSKLYFNFNSSSSNGNTTISDKIASLTKLGGMFLSNLTAGLFKFDKDSDAEINTSTMKLAVYNGEGDISAVSALDIEKPIELLKNSEVDALKLSAGPAEVVDLYTGIRYNIYWGGSPGKTHTEYSTLTPEDTDKKIKAAGTWPSWTPRPCILKIGGHQIAVGTHNYNHGSVIGGNPGDLCPDMPNIKPSGKDWPSGGHFCMYYKDSTTTSGEITPNAREHQNMAHKAYELATEMIKTAKEATKITNMVKDGDQKSLFAYLRGKGYSDEAISGILGCWNIESGNTARRIESDFLAPGTNLDNLINDRNAMDEYVRNVVWANTKNINEDAYYGTDGHLYPGIGYAQWTGPRGQALLEYAAKNHMTWDSPALQLDFMNHELTDPSSLYGPNNRKVLEKMNNAKSSEEAVKIWAKDFEGSNADSARIEVARQVYDEFKGDSVIPQNTEFGVGGGSDNEFRFLNNFINNSSKSNNSKNIGIGGGDDTSSIYNPKTVTATRKPEIIKSLNNDTSNYSWPNSSYRTKSISSNGTAATNNFITGNGSDNSDLIKLIREVLIELKSITHNTGSSSDLLEELNTKDFVDQGLRDSITAISKLKHKKSIGSVTSSGSNVRTVAALARP